jgi:hypothetical protein
LPFSYYFPLVKLEKAWIQNKKNPQETSHKEDAWGS